MVDIKKYILGILTGILITCGIGVTASVIYNSSEVGFTPTNTEWKVNNLQDAINDLYLNKTDFDSSNISFETYKGNRGNVTLSKSVDKGKYLAVVSFVEGSINSKAYDIDSEDEMGTVTGDKDCTVTKLSAKYIGKTATSTVGGAYPYFYDGLYLYQVEAKENGTTLTYQYSKASSASYADGVIFEIVPLG